MIRNITGVGAGNGPYISIQGGNFDLPKFTNSDRIAVEQHPYFAFGGDGGSTDVVPFIPRPCTGWKDLMDKTNFGVTTGGEWSLGFNDCGLMLHSTADQHTTTGCAQWDEWEKYTATQKQNLMSFAMSSMDALQDWFFWTWKIGPSAVDNSPRSPLWSYKLGVDNGWIPKNPRDAFGHCASVGSAVSTFAGPYPAWQTGGGNGIIDAADMAKFGSWPPASIGGVDDAANLPTYTATGPVPTLPPQSYPAPTPAASSADAGDGWYNSADAASGIVTVAGCAYPNAWDATGAAVPAAACTGAARKRDVVPSPVITQAP
jgi:glucan 1,3-beta-glucosidase